MKKLLQLVPLAVAFAAGFAVATAWRKPLPVVAQVATISYEIDIQRIRAFCNREPLSVFKANLLVCTGAELAGASEDLRTLLMPYAIDMRARLMKQMEASK